MTITNMHKSYTHCFGMLQLVDFKQESNNVVIEWE